MRIGDLIAERKYERGLSEDGLAEMFGVSQATTNRWITGTNIPTRPYWPAIAKFLGITQREVADLIVAEKRGRSPSGVEARLGRVETELVHLGRKLVDIDRTLAQVIEQLDQGAKKRR